MKKLLLTTLITGALAGSVFAQGLVQMAGHAYYNTTQGATTGTGFAIGNPSQAGTWGSLNVAIIYSTDAVAGLFGATTASSLSGNWTQATPLDRQVTAPGGSLALVTATVTDPSVQTAGSEEIFVVGWTGTATSWDAAWAANTGHNELLGWSGENSVGAVGWSQGYQIAPNQPTAFVTGSAAFNGIVLQPYAIVPEPTSFALAGLGLASLLIFRRRS